MEHSPFRHLCPELRNRIYEMTFTGSDGIVIDCTEPEQDSAKPTSKKAKVKSPFISFTRTCRQIRQESLKMYYSLNPVTILVTAPFGRTFPSLGVWNKISGYRRLLRTEQLSEIRHISIQLKIPPPNGETGVHFGALRMDWRKIWGIKSRFHTSARVEVQFEMALRPSSTPMAIVWTVGQPIGQLGERTPGTGLSPVVPLTKLVSVSEEALIVKDLLRVGICSVS